jgi:hypothetical protein
LTLKPLVDAFLRDKVKCTCFTYGQTGSGKTFTILGAEGKNDGLVFQAVRDLLVNLEDIGQLQFSFYEIYRGSLYDLLAKRRKILACEQDGIIKILGVRQVNVFSLEQIVDLINQGLESRKVGSTNANEVSSRSHAIMQFSCENSDAKLVIVDLAGSERGADRGCKNQSPSTRIEGSEINKSLLALKECIRAIDQDASHLPFRQSKLTQVLKDAFVGKGSMTTMIATISPTGNCYENSLNTLRYADRVKELSGGEKENNHFFPSPQVESIKPITPKSKTIAPSFVKTPILTKREDPGSPLKSPLASKQSSTIKKVEQNTLLKMALTNTSENIKSGPKSKEKIHRLANDIKDLTDKLGDEMYSEILELVREELESLKAALVEANK